MSCLFSSTLPYLCDIWTQANEQDEDSGEFIRTWTLAETARCSIVSISTKGKDGASLEVSRYSSDVYKYEEMVYVTMAKDIGENSRIVGIRSPDGTMLYAEGLTLEPTVFEVLGKTPVITDPFGGASGYKYLCGRSIVQEMNNAARY